VFAPTVESAGRVEFVEDVINVVCPVVAILDNHTVAHHIVLHLLLVPQSLHEL
jgi:hypothetical protein